jgi:hypothetical protein
LRLLASGEKPLKQLPATFNARDPTLIDGK